MNNIIYIPFSSIAEVNPPTSITYLTKETSVSFIPMADVTETGQWIRHQEFRLEDLLGHGYTTFQEGDVLFAKITPCMENGKGAHAINLVNGIGFGTTEFHILRTRINSNARFIYHWLQSDLLRLKAETLMTGSAGQRRVTSKFFDAYYIRSFPSSEQQHIAHILDTIDIQMQQVQQLIAKLKQIKTSILQDLLTRGIDENGLIRDPVAHPEDFKDSPLGRIPKKWTIKKLEDFYAEPARNGLYKFAKYYGKGCLMIHMPQMFKGLVVDPSEAARVEVTNVEQERFGLKAGDLVFARRSLNLEGAGRCSLVPELIEPTTFESSIIRIRLSKEQLRPSFANYFLNSDMGYRQRLPLIRQVAVSGVSSGDIASILLPCPHIEEQDFIIRFIQAQDAQVFAEEANLNKLKQIKKGLMHDLLTGQVRVTHLIEDEEPSSV